MKRPYPRIAPAGAALVCLFAAFACAPNPVSLTHAKAPADSGVLFLRLGPDTLFVERFELTGTRLYVESVVRSPRVTFRTIDAKLNPDGSFSSIRVAAFDPANPRGGAARDSATIDFSGDSTFYAFGIGSTRQLLRLAGHGDFVVSMPGSYWFPNHVLLAARAPRTVGDSTLGTMTSRLGAYPLVVKRVARDTVTIWSQLAGMMRVILGPDGRAVSLDGTASSLGYIGTRRDWIDIDSVSRAFAERERLAGPVGTLSPRDTVIVVIGRANLVIDYGRPSKRGRTIFGNVVPWNNVWRTGANLATHFTTSRELQFGVSVVPPGTYTLHTIPSPESWTLLISRQTGQWGTTALDPATVIARIPMRVRRPSETVETFTIGVVPAEAGATIRLAWDDTVAEADFTVR